MSDAIWITIFGAATSLLGIVIGQWLGRRAERHKQSLAIRVEMLKPVEEWLGGAERMIGILNDTMVSVLLGNQTPLLYNMDERRKAYQMMNEKTNIALGILRSTSLQTHSTKKLAEQLSTTIHVLDLTIKTRLLPSENEILDRAHTQTLTPEFMNKLTEEKLKLDRSVQTAYSLIAEIKTRLT